MAGEPDADLQANELRTLIEQIRERVRARYPDAAAAGVDLPDLMPVLHARDAAQAKVAAIGTVNPRPPGPLNNAIQRVKRLAARALDWHVREQVEFNRSVLEGFDAILEALNENNRLLVSLAAEHRALSAEWRDWRPAWERRLETTETELLRAMADLKGAFEFQITQGSGAIQRRLWADLDRVREEFERLIHTELRLIRQRCAIPSAPSPAPAPAPAPPLDYGRFADRFRGPEQYVLDKQRFYLPWFQGARDVLDLGCGRGEFLELMKEARIPATGVELSPELVGLCRAKGLEVVQADLLEHLASVPDESLGGVFSAHVVEHLPPERVPELVRTAASKLRRGGILAIETPNPECLAIFATHFYLDPTHVRPVPGPLLRFYLEEAGFTRIEVHRFSPAIEEIPALASLPEPFREAFFDGLDYAILARKL